MCWPVSFWKLGLPWFLLVVLAPTVLNLTPGLITKPQIRYTLVVLECAGTHLYVATIVGRRLWPAWTRREAPDSSNPTAWKTAKSLKIALGISAATTGVSLGMVGGIDMLSEQSLCLVRIRIHIDIPLA